MINDNEVEELDNNQISRAIVSRRRLLAVGGAGAVAIGLGVTACGKDSGVSGAPASASPASATGLAVEQMEGPYYLDYELFRRNVTEGKKGVPLNLRLTVLDATTGKPLPNAAVEIWHCDALGIYSGYGKAGNTGGRPSGQSSGIPTAFPSGAPSGMPSGAAGRMAGGHQQPTDKLTFLRGVQMSDSGGGVQFRTIFPGWYSGRAIHIHTKVHVGGTHVGTGYEGGHVCHTGQLYFEEDTVAKVEALSPYRTNTVVRTKLEQDNIYRAAGGGGGAAGLLTLRQSDGQDITKGIVATLVMEVDPSKTNTGEDGGAGSPTGTS